MDWICLRFEFILGINRISDKSGFKSNNEGIDIDEDHSSDWGRWDHSRSLPPSGLMRIITRIVFCLQFDPIFEYHFKLFVDEIVSESVSSGFILDKIVFSGVTLFHGSVEVDTVPVNEIMITSNGASTRPYWDRMTVSFIYPRSRHTMICRTNIGSWTSHCPSFYYF